MRGRRQNFRSILHAHEPSCMSDCLLLACLILTSMRIHNVNVKVRPLHWLHLNQRMNHTTMRVGHMQAGTQVCYTIVVAYNTFMNSCQTLEVSYHSLISLWVSKYLQVSRPKGVFDSFKRHINTYRYISVAACTQGPQWKPTDSVADNQDKEILPAPDNATLSTTKKVVNDKTV